jgi:hypothetical protein
VAQNPAGRDLAAMQHRMQVFDSAESAADTVAAFLREGLACGDTLLVTMRLAHWNLVSARLVSASLADAIAKGQLTVLDANRTLGRIMWNGIPSEALFEDAVGKLVRQLAARAGRLRVYGDMVDILAGEGNFAAARDLESFWMRLLPGHCITLFCGYSAAHVQGTASDPLQSILTLHSQIRPHAFVGSAPRAHDDRQSRA